MSWDNPAKDSGGDTPFEPDGVFVPDNSGDFAAGTSGDFGGGAASFGEGDGGGNGGDGDDRACRICEQTGHIARDCPEKPPMECYNCGEVGHSKSECTNPRVDRPFTGTCRLCNTEGHRAADCPDKAPEKCRLCDQEGHKAIECTAKRTDMFREARDMTDEEAWKLMKQAAKVKDMDDLRNAFHAYCKFMYFKKVENDAVPPVKAEELEDAFRQDNIGVYLIAKEKVVEDIYTIVSPAGDTDQKFILTLQWSDQPKRARDSKGWPKDAEENLKRLESSGFQIDRGIPKCSNCQKLGHIKKSCPEAQVESTYEAPKIMCCYCSKEGHRGRDCEDKPQELCRNCKQPGHRANECTNPRDTSDVECKACGEMGHFSRDCPTKPQGSRACHKCGEEGHIGKDCTNPPNPALMVCRNCDEQGHVSRECKKPTDWSRVRCKQCGNTGHTIKRCPEANAEPAGGDGGFTTPAPAEIAAAPAGDWGNNDTSDTGGVAIETSGGW